MSLTKVDFSLLVEGHRTDESLLDVCIKVADEHDIDHELIPTLITRSLRDKMEVEAIDNRTLRKEKPANLDWLGL